MIVMPPPKIEENTSTDNISQVSAYQNGTLTLSQNAGHILLFDCECIGLTLSHTQNTTAQVELLNPPISDTFSAIQTQASAGMRHADAVFSTTTTYDSNSLSDRNFEQDYTIIAQSFRTPSNLATEGVLFDTGGTGTGIGIFWHQSRLKFSVGRNNNIEVDVNNINFAANTDYAYLLEIDKANDVVRVYLAQTNSIETISQENHTLYEVNGWTDTDWDGGGSMGVGSVGDSAQGDLTRADFTGVAGRIYVYNNTQLTLAQPQVVDVVMNDSITEATTRHITINDANYDHVVTSTDTVQTVLNSLRTLITDNTSIDVQVEDNKLVLSADNTFTYSASVIEKARKKVTTNNETSALINFEDDTVVFKAGDVIKFSSQSNDNLTVTAWFKFVSNS